MQCAMAPISYSRDVGLTSRRYEVQTSVEANILRDENNLLHQYPEKIVIRQDIWIVTGYPLDIILDSKHTISTSSGYPEDDRCYLRGWEKERK